MKKITVCSAIAAAAALLAPASSATAGNLFIAQPSPTFTPDTAFTIVVQSEIPFGPGINLNGGATITPDASNQVSIALGGTFGANPGDLFSGAYSFAADLNISTPVTYTITVRATVMGAPIAFQATGALMPGLHQYQGALQAPAAFPAADSGDFSATLVLDFGSVGESATTPGTLTLTIDQGTVQLDPNPATVQGPALSMNISTRADVGTGEHVLIAGFIITGNDPKTVVLRGIGPSLGISGVTGVLADPMLELHDSTGALVATNDNWMDLSTDDQTTLSDNMLTLVIRPSQPLSRRSTRVPILPSSAESVRRPALPWPRPTMRTTAPRIPNWPIPARAVSSRPARKS